MGGYDADASDDSLVRRRGTKSVRFIEKKKANRLKRSLTDPNNRASESDDGQDNDDNGFVGDSYVDDDDDEDDRHSMHSLTSRQSGASGQYSSMAESTIMAYGRTKSKTLKRKEYVAVVNRLLYHHWNWGTKPAFCTMIEDVSQHLYSHQFIKDLITSPAAYSMLVLAQIQC